VVFVQRGPELAPLVELQPAAYEAPPSTAAALPAPLASSTLRRDPSTEQRAFDKAHQAFDRGRLDDALAALAAYEREYPQGAYAAEGETLRARIAQIRAEVTATP
jgi:TolA-binding protein